MPYTVNLVAVPEQAIAFLREPGPISGLEERLRLLRESISQDGVRPAGAFMSRHFDEAEEDGDADYEVAVPITAQADGSLPGRVGEARVTVIPAHHAFVTHHSGPHEQLPGAHAALFAYLDALGYSAAGPVCRIYLRGPESASDPAQYVTEVRLPIAR